MITCKKCKEQNPSHLTMCQNCGHNLLPGESFSERLGIFITSLVAMGISIGALAFLTKHPKFSEASQCCMFARPELWFLGIVGFPIIGIVNALRKTPLYQRYLNRANRHTETDPDQALADYSEALALAPEKQKAQILKQRSALLTKLGKDQDSLKDHLEYMQKDEAYQGTSSFAHVFGLDEETIISGARENEQKLLVSSGKSKAIGYCSKCQKAVVLDENLKCSIHPKNKTRETTLVMPDEVENSLQELTLKLSPVIAKEKKKRTIFLIIAAIAITICCVIPMVIGLFSELMGKISPDKTPTQGEESDGGVLLTNPTIAPTSTEEVLYLRPNFLNDPQTACFFHSGGMTCLDEWGWHVYDRDDFGHPLHLPYDIFHCEDGRIFIKSIDFYEFKGETLEKLGDSPEEIEILRDVEMLACGDERTLWVTHDHGVSSFDGFTWRTFGASEYLGIGESGESPEAIVIAPNGEVWITTGNSIALYNGVAWVVFTTGQRFEEDLDPRDLAIDINGNVWIINSYNALFKFEGNQWLRFDSPGAMLHQLVVDKEGIVWIASDQGILTFNTATSSWGTNFGQETFSDDYLTDLQFDGQGRLWVTSWYGIYVFDGLSWTSYRMDTANLFDNEPDRVVVLGTGPRLPDHMQKEPGSVSGKLIKTGITEFTNIQVEVCLRGVIIAYYGATPCAGQAFHALATVNPDGTFIVADIPAGKYELMVQIDADTWFSSVSFEISPGTETNLGEINIAED